MPKFIGLLFLLIFHIGPTIATAVVAHRKNRRWIIWGIVGLIFPILALIVVCLLAPVVAVKRCSRCNRFARASTQSCPLCNIPMPEGPLESGPDPAAGGRSAWIVAAVLAVPIGVAIIGILAAIAIPQFAMLVAKSQEGSARAGLTLVRTAIESYRAKEGRYPRSLTDLTTGGAYLAQLPVVTIPRTSHNPGHNSTATVTYASRVGSVTDTGGYWYDDREGPTFGKVEINCSHQDMKSRQFDSY